nr:EOG090X07B6 [Ilyocryptus agilis]
MAFRLAAAAAAASAAAAAVGCIVITAPAAVGLVGDAGDAGVAGEEKTEIEGTLFLYTRSGDPKHGFVVMNRLSTENLVEPITKDLEIQLQAPFLLYKNAKFVIIGVWFYEESECTRIAQKLEALVKEESRRRRPNVQEMTKSVDILSLLTKAHGEYEQKGKSTNVPVSAANNVDVVRPTAVRPTTNGVTPNTSTPLSVADLFATGEAVGPVTPIPIHHGGSLFERLLSSGGTPTGVPPPAHTAQSLEREFRGKEKTTNGPTTEQQCLPHAAPIRSNAGHRPGGLGAATVSISHPQVAELMQQGPSATPPPPRHPAVQSVALMSPMMFASAGGGSDASSMEPARVQTPVARAAYAVNRPDDLPFVSQEESEVTPLTKAQLLQTFNYLLKNDPNFITQLHDAYVQSLKQSLKTSQH